MNPCLNVFFNFLPWISYVWFCAYLWLFSWLEKQSINQSFVVGIKNKDLILLCQSQDPFQIKMTKNMGEIDTVIRVNL